MLVTIQSYGRPENVENMLNNLEGKNPIWFVPESQVKDYEAAGASCFGVEEKQYPMKTLQFNSALEEGFSKGESVVTMDDDFEKAIFVNKEGDEIIEQRDSSLIELIDVLAEETAKSPYFLGGFASNHNPFWCYNGVRDYGMMTGQIHVHKPNSIRYDDRFTFIEDLEIIINHHKNSGGVCKLSNYIAKFDIISPNRKKAYTGGFTTQRTKEKQQELLNLILQKHADENIIFPDGPEVGTNLTKRIKWKKLRGNASGSTLDAFFE